MDNKIQSVLYGIFANPIHKMLSTSRWIKDRLGHHY
jgi:hypothetical protein